ncbi:hypothetical protein VTJ49DRAFT_1234 [Mycothermus thermophilus]|uniref:Uncharacterized protein n=1 Tax=Humicola insolens TaxID=85995 RepID=A0ABR3VD22_HUMIN
MMATFPSVMPPVAGNMLAKDSKLEPAPFTFQSDLSDDDDEDDDAAGDSTNHETNGRDPLALNDFARVSLAALGETIQQDPPEDDRTLSQDEVLPTTEIPAQEDEDVHMSDARDDEIPGDDDEPEVERDAEVNADHVIDYDAADGAEPEPTPALVDIEVCLPWMSPEQRAEYEQVEVEEYYSETDGFSWRRRRGDEGGDYADQFGTRKRKRNDDDYVSSIDGNEDSAEDELQVERGRRPKLGPIDDFLEVGASRRSTRLATRPTSQPFSSEGETRTQRLRSRASSSRNYDDKDELQASEGEDDDPSFFVQSDIVKTRGRPRGTRLRRAAAKPPLSRRRSTADDSDIEFEPSRRRSARANKNTRNLADGYAEADEDDDIYCVDTAKAPAAPRVVGVREIFQPVPDDFKEAHRPVCDTCGNGKDNNKGAMIPCQGCSNSYHKLCIGNRSGREHRVTKVADDSFVLQCRFCICTYKKKDERAPNHDTCGGCQTKNPSCAPFSERKTPKQEEALRNENGGVDPITPVDPKLINNPDHVLFRCARCHRGWHYEHLPHPTKQRDPAIDDPLNLRKHRRDEYQITWTCKMCQDTEDDKVDKIVAWRPVNRSAYEGKEGLTVTDFGEDDLEYLVKWEGKSYNHCVWVPGTWLYGVVTASMRLSFIKRTFGDASEEDTGPQHVDSLLRWTEKEAIHDSWITPDIILDVHYAPRSAQDEKKYRSKPVEERFEDDLSRIFSVIRIYVKFEGLGYDDAVWDAPPDPDAGPIYDAFCEAYREFLNGRHFKSEPPKVMRERIEEFRRKPFVELTEQPKGLQRGKLMEYQLSGVNWILYNYRVERSVILADEMGLGKTVQVVAVLSSFIQEMPRVWPFLVVVPNATCANWRREIKKWAPDLRVVAYYGGRMSQTLALNYELFPNGARDLKAHVLGNIKWAGMIVDEAQALKNDGNSLYRALNQMRVPFKLLLTGTPLQNNKRELFNLLQFIDPAMNAEKLDEQFANITSENLPDLHNLIRPYFLRRTKAEVLTFLPPMAQIIVPVSMTVLQERLCKSIMERNPELIRSVFVQNKMKSSERGSLSNILMQLRKCLCHPFIYSQAIEDRNMPPDVARRNLIEASSKLMFLEIMLPKLKDRGHRVLIFSQFLDQITILEDFLAGMGMKHERLDGNQSSMEKQKKIDAFNAPDSDLFAMLLSTRAGGVGINLYTADTVIILDPDWNPHQDIQALSRAHRIGQKKKVLCFQLMTVDSAEEKILQIGRKKLALDHLLIETMDNDEDAPNDVESVLKHGAAALFGEGKRKDAITYDSAAVDKLLDRSTMEETKTDEKKSAESAFAYARIWANDEGGLTDDLPETEHSMNLSVWDQILQQRAEEARKEAERNMQMLGRGARRRGAEQTNYTGPRFEFDDQQDKAESDHDDVDGDFVGGDSDAESSEAELGDNIVNDDYMPSRRASQQLSKASQDVKQDKAESAAVKKPRPSSRSSSKSSSRPSSREGKPDKGQQGPAVTPAPPSQPAAPEQPSNETGPKPRGRPRKHPPKPPKPPKQAPAGPAGDGAGTGPVPGENPAVNGAQPSQPVAGAQPNLPQGRATSNGMLWAVTDVTGDGHRTKVIVPVPGMPGQHPSIGAVPLSGMPGGFGVPASVPGQPGHGPMPPTIPSHNPFPAPNAPMGQFIPPGPPGHFIPQLPPTTGAGFTPQVLSPTVAPPRAILPSPNPHHQARQHPAQVAPVADMGPTPGSSFTLPPFVAATSTDRAVLPQLCPVCSYSHPPEWLCPEMQSEVRLRLALDMLRKKPGVRPDDPSPEERERRWKYEMIWRQLRRVAGERLARAGEEAGGGGGGSAGMGGGL